MSTRAAQFEATVRSREPLTDHLVRLVLDGLDGFESTGVPDEWVGLVVPGQFQSRYYTVRSFSDGVLTLDVVVHDVGLVTEWAMRDCIGDTVTITEPRSSFAPPPGAGWLLLVGDLTAMPAIARIVENHPDLPTYVLAEVSDDLAGYLPDHAQVTWLAPPSSGQSALAHVVEGIDWPAGEGYFWMAGESAQMRAIRKHLMREIGLPTSHYDVMGYWRATAGRQPRAVDPGPIWRAGKAAGKSDEQIWAEYDAAREATDG
ncbi:NADPH-dependent ferric siderophore reductase, contains FAD-binding and SIP domains [Nocardioides alpinus]|uniref:NADPH-dependent ferric siderophore reductase, contains FAD-binding and SIP domains n=1 Tax=Nocardioides alpinus TaxID=748909 RepID=A0A1I0XXR8_9ACTN|nr:siderophore-interacting protein [Nocardioides alpinus]PKH42815.1 siderophore-interacting protein [Nocardioides alpinus]SFB05080.1 NADPH-dependent ferric siderophore reductase, contains FAD-binding and SIP domains [Nocardioides alpinus]